MRITDECGVWEVTEGEGCINRIIVEPTEEYFKRYPPNTASE